MKTVPQADLPRLLARLSNRPVLLVERGDARERDVRSGMLRFDAATVQTLIDEGRAVILARDGPEKDRIASALRNDAHPMIDVTVYGPDGGLDDRFTGGEGRRGG